MGQNKIKKTFWPDPGWSFVRRDEYGTSVSSSLSTLSHAVALSTPSKWLYMRPFTGLCWTLLGFRPHITRCSPVCWTRNHLPRGKRGLRDSSQHLVWGQKNVSGVLSLWLPRSPTLITQVVSAHFTLSDTSTGGVALHPASLLLSSPSLFTWCCRKNQGFLHCPLL